MSIGMPVRQSIRQPCPGLHRIVSSACPDVTSDGNRASAAASLALCLPSGVTTINSWALALHHLTVRNPTCWLGLQWLHPLGSSRALPQGCDTRRTLKAALSPHDLIVQLAIGLGLLWLRLSKITMIGTSAFYGCASLISATLA